eukprot:TRINITY_DN1606_c0_g1_i1.p1 TRINITY_DN1606_c0_g1~~TRINITY_DN1606_c0_g1_i1.p1  ORF type:complete len:120 (+),score=44.85 TRINITY_DN1606_c0_g1_i1:192-551(+)
MGLDEKMWKASRIGTVRVVMKTKQQIEQMMTRLTVRKLGFEDKTFEELVELIIQTKTKLYKEKSERLLKEQTAALAKHQEKEKQTEAELERMKSSSKRMEEQLSTLQKKEKVPTAWPLV